MAHDVNPRYFVYKEPDWAGIEDYQLEVPEIDITAFEDASQAFLAPGLNTLETRRLVQRVTCRCAPPCGAEHWEHSGPLEYLVDGKQVDFAAFQQAAASQGISCALMNRAEVEG